MGAFGRDAVRDFAPNAASGAHDRDDLARQFAFFGHPLEFGFFQQPVFDVKRFLLWQRDILGNRFSSAHDFDGAAIKFGGHAAFRFVFAPRDQAQSGNQKHGRIRVAHRG